MLSRFERLLVAVFDGERGGAFSPDPRTFGGEFLGLSMPFFSRVKVAKVGCHEAPQAHESARISGVHREDHRSAKEFSRRNTDHVGSSEFWPRRTAFLAGLAPHARREMGAIRKLYRTHLGSQPTGQCPGRWPRPPFEGAKLFGRLVGLDVEASLAKVLDVLGYGRFEFLHQAYLGRYAAELQARILIRARRAVQLVERWI